MSWPAPSVFGRTCRYRAAGCFVLVHASGDALHDRFCSVLHGVLRVRQAIPCAPECAHFFWAAQRNTNV